MSLDPTADRIGLEPREVDLTPIYSPPLTRAESRAIGAFCAAERAKHAQNPEFMARYHRFLRAPRAAPPETPPQVEP